MSYERHAYLSVKCKAFSQENLEFQEKVLARSGLGEETYLPECECFSLAHPSCGQDLWVGLGICLAAV